MPSETNELSAVAFRLLPGVAAGLSILCFQVKGQVYTFLQVIELNCSTKGKRDKQIKVQAQCSF